ncbi:ATP-binding protein [Brevibacillus laterosporus]|uniref:ATP-binding protein n=1 Tax=Brevibacillus laterosporus TaxID=1465 RepID=UPI000839CAF5|nr:ATP-binding protein [Brevibacillus laterosporus]
MLNCDRNLYVYADARRIEQVIVNLLSNAIRHTVPDGMIRISVYQNAGTIYLRVENAGAPIPEKDLDLIWNQFYRVGSSRDRKSGGEVTFYFKNEKGNQLEWKKELTLQ